MGWVNGAQLGFPTVIDEEERDLALVVPLAGRLEDTGDPWLPFRLVDSAGKPVEAVAAFFRDLQAAGRVEATLRSYGMDLLRWFRFLWAVDVPWERATRIEARDFCRWMLLGGKPSRPHWRNPGQAPDSGSTGQAYAPSVRAHSETVLRGFYDFCAMRRSVISPVQRGEMWERWEVYLWIRWLTLHRKATRGQ